MLLLMLLTVVLPVQIEEERATEGWEIIAARSLFTLLAVGVEARREGRGTVVGRGEGRLPLEANGERVLVPRGLGERARVLPPPPAAASLAALALELCCMPFIKCCITP